jgi:periplasmic copper chaperone A
MRGALLAAGLAGMLVLPGWAHEFAAGGLTIGHPYAFATAPGARAGAGYFSVTNAGAELDRLVAVKADFPRVELHETEVDAAGVARMAAVEAVEVPAGATVALEPRGVHVMFMGLTAPLAPEGRIPAVLVFEKAGEIAVEFAVEPRGADDAGHDAHGTGASD